jgi:hypothetical protein
VEPEPATEKDATKMSEQIFIEKWARFLVIDDKWNIQIWPDQAPAEYKLYRLRIPVPAELVGGQVVLEVVPATSSDPTPT